MRSFVSTFGLLCRVDPPTSGADPEQHYVHRAYDPNGRLAWSSLPVTAMSAGGVTDDQRTRLEYWDPGWIRASKDPATPRVRYDYTAECWQSRRTPENAAGQLDVSLEMRWSYDADGKLKEVKDSGGQPSTYGYDANNRLRAARDASGLTTEASTAVDVELAYDGLDRLATVRQKPQTQQNWRVGTLAYDLTGNVVGRIDAREETASGVLVHAGREHQFTYDRANWLTVQRDTGTDAGVGDDQRIATTFWASGRERRRVIEKSDGAGGWSPLQTTEWDYFANRKLRSVTTKDGHGAVVESHQVGYFEGEGRYANGHRTSDVFSLLGPDAASPCRTTSCTARYTYDARERLASADRDVQTPLMPIGAEHDVSAIRPTTVQRADTSDADRR